MKRSLYAMIFLVAPVLAACAQPPLPKDHFYRLSVGAPENPLTEPRFKGTLEIGRFIADGLTSGRPVVYSKADRPHELLEYYYHFWTEPPPTMLRDQLVDYLRAAKVTTMVVTPEMRVEPDYVLAGRIKRLEKINGSPPGAVVELELALRRTADNELLFLGTYGVEAKAGAHTVAAAVAAFNDALTEIYAKFTADISGL
ncbi:MAG: membrane integrity-associated transporter subunit PqiC [Proteobacteria bacterium]|nr:membrane integrity-associated transporter subunit PqiC [Pseudomonadota bacterium]